MFPVHPKSGNVTPETRTRNPSEARTRSRTLVPVTPNTRSRDFRKYAPVTPEKPGNSYTAEFSGDGRFLRTNAFLVFPVNR